MTLQIRRAVPAEAASLAAFGAHAFRDWYAAFNDPADLEQHVARTYGEAQQSQELADPLCEYTLAIVDDAIAGYALVRAGNRHPGVAGPDPGEVCRFYLARAHHGRGVAPALMTAAFEAARARRIGTLWLGAWDQNPRALAFYAKMGFVDVGSTTFVLGSTPQVDRLLVRTL